MGRKRHGPTPEQKAAQLAVIRPLMGLMVVILVTMGILVWYEGSPNGKVLTIKRPVFVTPEQRYLKAQQKILDQHERRYKANLPIVSRLNKHIQEMPK